MIELKNVSKFYYSKGIIASGFTKVNLKLNIGEFVAITGESGSGKSTLLNVISGLDTYEEGEMYVDGKETSHYIEKDWENYRRKYIGNIYQNFNLINSYTVYQNIDLILSLNGVKKKQRKVKTLELLKRVDMLNFKNTKVSKLSGGQKQRVAIARALAKDVPVIIADEPTGNLDKRSAEEVIKLLSEISKDKLIVIVTHNYEQVEEYVSRKIIMHDGKILEDKKIKKDEESHNDYNLSNYTFKNIRIFDKLKLGFKNTFNIFPKFILLLAVYLFIVVGLMSEYSFFKEGEYETESRGYNYAFNDKSDKRIIINKKDRTPFTTEEIKKLKNNQKIDYIIENDIAVDSCISFADEEEKYWVDALLRDKELLEKKDIIGRYPEADDEILIEGYKDDYLFYDNKILDKDLYLWNSFQGVLDKNKKYKVTGIKYYNEEDEEYDLGTRIYVSKKIFDDQIFEAHQTYSKVSIDFINEYYESTTYSDYMRVVPNEWVYEGTAFISEDENYRCNKFNCIDNYITITVSNIYYSDTKSFRIAKTYNNKNINYIMNLPSYNKDNYSSFNGKIYINTKDYESFYNKGTYQMSVYAKNSEDVDALAKLLNKNYNTLKIKDTLVVDITSKIIRILKIVVTIVFVIVLFFISYFVIKIILKSRNIYFSILRMLGASRKVCTELLITELFIISNISYFLFLLITYFNKIKLINIKFLSTINTYLTLNDYVILYVIIGVMSLLLSARYSRKLFKTSVMTAYKEEV